METAELEQFRDQLLGEREDIRRQLVESGADPDAESIEGLDFDFGFADSAQSTAERNKVLALIEGLRERLRDVDTALGKMERGGFGACERCGQPISPERLEAIPWAHLCMSCKQKG